MKIVQWPSLEVDMELGAHESGAAVTDIAWSPDERVIVSCAAGTDRSSTTGSDSNRTDNGNNNNNNNNNLNKKRTQKVPSCGRLKEAKGSRRYRIQPALGLTAKGFRPRRESQTA